MADNQYRKYLEEQQHQQEKGSAANTLLSFGTAVTGGAAAFRYRKQIKHHTKAMGHMVSGTTTRSIVGMTRSRFLQNAAQRTGANLKALDHALEGASPLGLLTRQGRDRFSRRIDDSLESSYERRSNMPGGPLGDSPLEVETSFDQTMRGLKANRKTQIKQMRMQKIRGAIDGDLSGDMLDNMINNLQGILNDQEDKFFSSPGEGKIKALFDKYTKPADGSKSPHEHALEFSSKAQRDKVEKKLYEVLTNYKDETLLEGRTIKQQQEKLEGVLTEELKKRHQKKDNFFTKMMSNIGYEPITMKHVMDHNLTPDGGALNVPNKTGVHRRGRRMDRLKQWAKTDKDIYGMVADHKVFINKEGQIADFRGISNTTFKALTAFRENFQVPFLRFNPLDLAHFSSIQAAKEAPYMYLLRRGTIDPLLGASKGIETTKHPMAHNQDAAVGTLAKDYLYVNGSVYDTETMDKVKDNVYLASARFGAAPRALAGMANLHRQDYRDRKGVLGSILNLFDLGKQESDSFYSRVKSTFTKFDDPDWERNQLRRLYLMNGAGEYHLEDIEGIFRNTNSLLEQKTKRLSDDAADYLNEHVKQAYGDIGVNLDLKNLDTDEKVMEAIGQIKYALSDPGSGAKHVEGLTEQFNQLASQYRANPLETVKGKRVLGDDSMETPEAVSTFTSGETDLVSIVEDARRLIHQHAARQVDNIDDIVLQGVQEGVLKQKDLDGLRNLENLTEMRNWWGSVYDGSPTEKGEALKEFASIMGDYDSSAGTAFRQTINDFTPIYSPGPGEKPPQHFGYVGFMTVNKNRGWQDALTQFNQNLSSGDGFVKSGAKAAARVLGQPFAGRRNLEDVTTLSIASYYMTERLDNAFAKLGLGLSQRNRGSMQSIIANQLGRRIILPMMAIQQAQYVDRITGGMFSDQAADAYVNMHQDVGWMKETLGLNDVISKGKMMFDGSDQFNELPFMKLFNFATFGLLSDDRSDEELEQYYTSGEDAVRRGRYWGIGSNTPWMGGKIDRYEPNWYRKLKSDWKFQDNTYGSHGEYYRNHWMPTLSNPIAPITYLMGGHDHYERKLMDERPYAVYGGVNEIGQLPIIGAPLNATIGRLISPQYKHPELEKAHRTYIEEINNYYASQYEGAQSGGTVELLSSGGYRIGGGGSGGYVGAGSVTGMGGRPAGSSAAPAGGGGGGGSATFDVGDYSQTELSSINYSLASGGSPVRSISSLNSLRDPDIVADLNDIGTVGNMSGVLRDSFYSASEVAGIYGFSLKSFSGFEESGRGMVLEPSSRMMSYARAWWDMELGSLDFMHGDFSEIFRRYVPRDPNKNYWNPIRNKMPEWLPGPEYFTDFQHGDPYTKVAKGEIRLPGAAYESLYDLHPDAFGKYGAFDRFRILADVAPYSDNYKFYRRVVSQMNQEGLLTDGMKGEYAEIRDQVSSRKSKYNFYDRKFRDSDINVESVTVSEVIDSNTFITEEYGWENPIKLAGVHVKSDDLDAQDLVSQFIYSGARIKVGLDADPLFRVRDDMMNTMRAVVYTGDNEEGVPFYMSSKGQNLNNILANRTFGGFMGLFGGDNNVTVKHDGSATSTRAIFSPDQITVGKIWESIIHDVAPNVPGVGVLFDKFMQVRSPLEQYKRMEVYGQAWKPWDITEFHKNWIQPMVETIAERHPLIASAQGAGIGWLAGKKAGKKWLTPIGAIVGGLASSLRVFGETADSLDGDAETWIPERRRREREINEYFDRLKYAKYRGLYEKASELAKKREGIDIDKILSDSEERGAKNKSARRYLETQKKYLSIAKELGYGDDEAIRERIERVRGSLKEIEEDKQSVRLGPNAMLALRYRAEYESTLYGADPLGSMQQIFRALPSKDREFFTEFMNASPEDREEILRLVPKDQRKFYQARWGLEVDEQESLASYFSRHHLPDEDWAGWKASTSLDAIKVKVVQNEGLELTEFGYWGDDVKRAKQVKAEPINMNSLSGRIDIPRLEKVLRGAGLEDVSVTMTTAQGDGNKVELAMDVMRDRSRDIVNEINNNLAGLFA